MQGWAQTPLDLKLHKPQYVHAGAVCGRSPISTYLWVLFVGGMMAKWHDGKVAACAGVTARLVTVRHVGCLMWLVSQCTMQVENCRARSKLESV